MGYTLEVRETPSIPDLFRDAARHKLTEMRDYSGGDFKTARIVIEPSQCVTSDDDMWSFPTTFKFGPFQLHWFGEYVLNETEYGRFIGTGQYQDKLSLLHPDWLDMDITELMFQCCQAFIKVCEQLRNGELEPFEDEEDESED
jgi:hypothetical protein